MPSDTDESYDPHARMDDSFPRADSGSEDKSFGQQFITQPRFLNNGLRGTALGDSVIDMMQAVKRTRDNYQRLKNGQ